MIGDAVISSCGSYRYMLSRKWSEGDEVLFVMLNPSTADAMQDDPTIGRCISFAQAWGFGSLAVANLFAYRTPSPAALREAASPIGEENDQWLDKLTNRAALTVAAWGNNGSYLDRGRHVAARLNNPHYLRLTSQGQPGHPLYIPGDSRPVKWSVPA